MTGPEHYAEAERLLAMSLIPSNERATPKWLTADELVAKAHVHATLAMAAASATAWFDSGLDEAWLKAAGTPAQVTS